MVKTVLIAHYVCFLDMNSSLQHNIFVFGSIGNLTYLVETQSIYARYLQLYDLNFILQRVIRL